MSARVSDSPWVELDVGKHMCSCGNTGIANDDGAKKGGLESGKQRWVNERLSEEKRIRKTVKEFMGVQVRNTSAKEDERCCTLLAITDMEEVKIKF